MMKKVLYICMPFASASWGSLALGTLKAIGQREGISADVSYLNIPFVTTIGEERYNELREKIQAEICFTMALFPDVSPVELWRQYLSVNRGARVPDAETLGELERDFVEIAARQAPELLDKAMAEIAWEDYDIIGFTTGYNQTVASLAMARRIREQFPEKVIIFGGAACDGEMGPALLREFPTIDVVVSGEADTVIVPLIHALRAQQPVNHLPRVHARVSSRVLVDEPRAADVLPLARQAGSGQEAENKIPMDDLPIPDYDDYFRQVEGLDFEDVPRLTFESSRGCWWGQKHLCSFCGLNGTSLAYRAKSPQKVLNEIRTQYLRYRRKNFLATDNIFDMSYFKTLLPGLKSLHEEYGINVFYETKSNLRTDQIRALSKAGVNEVQPGIESFSDHVLKLMDKGTHGLNQVRFLRDCSAHDIKTHYGILWGHPGETASDYHQMADLVPSIRHLPPPNYIVPVFLERFSPYFMTPDQFGIRNIRPAPIYPVMFGGRSLDYGRIAYIFYYEHDSDQNQELVLARERLADAVAEWKQDYQPDTLIAAEFDDVLYLADRRDSDLKLLRLTHLDKDVFTFCEQPHTEAEIKTEFPQVQNEWLVQFLTDLVERRLMLAWVKEDHSRYLALPVSVSTQALYEKVLQPRARKCSSAPLALTVSPTHEQETIIN
jgi:ribosomal peptide maturation radical SAM protein 1